MTRFHVKTRVNIKQLFEESYKWILFARLLTSVKESN